jgi:hypothetical protein
MYFRSYILGGLLMIPLLSRLVSSAEASASRDFSFVEERMDQVVDWAQDSSKKVVRRVVSPLFILDRVELPETLAKYDISISLKPKLRDIVDGDFWRVPLEIRYGASDRLDVSLQTLFYTESLFNKPSKCGIAQLQPGIKYQWLNSNEHFVDTALGFDTLIPVGQPPPQLTDGYVRYRPYISISRTLDRWPNITVYHNLGYEFVGSHIFEGDPIEVFTDDNLQFLWGFFYKYTEWRYGLNVVYRFSVDDISNDQKYVEPFIVWDIPRKYTSYFSGNWQAGATYRFGQTLEGSESNITFRLRWRFDVKAWLKNL